MLSTITNIISIIAVAQLFLFSGYLLTSGKRTTGKITLALFLITNAIFIFNFVVLHSKELIPYLIHFLYVGESFGFLFGPLLYLYTKSVTAHNFRFSKKHYLHIIPFIIVTTIILFRYQFQSYERKLEILSTGLFSGFEWDVFIISMNLFTFLYLANSMLIVRKRNKNLRSYYSSVEKINFDWLNLVITAFFLMWIADLLNWMLSNLKLNTPPLREFITFISLLINFVFANLLIFKNLRQVQLEDETKLNAPSQENEIITKPRYINSSLTENEKKEILDGLENLMKQEKLYLNPSLNLGEIAQRLSVSPRYLSQVINELKKQNFYDYVNSYRIDEVKKLLREPEYRNEKILAILYDSGFNSKSVFNTAFKKFTGLTPSEYRKNYKFTA